MNPQLNKTQHTSLSLLIAATAMLSGAVSAQPNSEISVVRPGGQTLVIRQRSSGVSSDVWALAQSLEAIDRSLRTPLSQSAASDRELESEIRKIALDLRDEAVDSLNQAFEIQARTSGSLDSELVATSNARVGEARQLLVAPPARLFVSTNLVSATAGTILQYMSAGEYRLRADSWVSYSPGERMRIGRYVFRLYSQASGKELYKEFISVLYDPTARVLTAVTP